MGPAAGLIYGETSLEPLLLVSGTREAHPTQTMSIAAAASLPPCLPLSDVRPILRYKVYVVVV